MISVAMATYNGERFIREQINSILRQTFTDFELVICDDCSADRTVSIIKEFQMYDKRVVLYENEHNLGFKDNFEKAISLCHGEYIATSDQDDIWEKSHLSVLYGLCKNSLMACGDALLVDERNVSKNLTLKQSMSIDIDSDSPHKLFRILNHGNMYAGSVCIYKKELFEKALPIPKEIKLHDSWFSACAACIGEIKYTSEILTRHRIHGENESGQYNPNWIYRMKINFGKHFETDRLCYCEELKNRYDGKLSLQVKKVIEISNKNIKNKVSNKKIPVLLFFLKNYKWIYFTKSRKEFFPRLIKNLLNIGELY